MTHNIPSNKSEQGRGASDRSLREQLTWMIGQLPEDRLSLGQLLDIFGEDGLLLLTILLTLVFLIPVSIPGVSTVFGAAILLIGGGGMAVHKLIRKMGEW